MSTTSESSDSWTSDAMRQNLSKMEYHLEQFQNEFDALALPDSNYCRFNADCPKKPNLDLNQIEDRLIAAIEKLFTLIPTKTKNIALRIQSDSDSLETNDEESDSLETNEGTLTSSIPNNILLRIQDESDSLETQEGNLTSPLSTQDNITLYTQETISLAPLEDIPTSLDERNTSDDTSQDEITSQDHDTLEDPSQHGQTHDNSTERINYYRIDAMKSDLVGLVEVLFDQIHDTLEYETTNKTTTQESTILATQEAFHTSTAGQSCHQQMEENNPLLQPAPPNDHTNAPSYSISNNTCFCSCPKCASTMRINIISNSKLTVSSQEVIELDDD